MSDMKVWGFTDDRGTALSAVRGPARVVAYVRAGAALLDLGVTPVAVYGSGHDGEGLDPVKAGKLAAAGVPYLGPGRALDEARLRSLGPELIVDVTYDGKSAYALDEGVADRLGVPLAALSVGNELPLAAIIGRFGELATALGAAPDGGALEGVASDGVSSGGVGSGGGASEGVGHGGVGLGGGVSSGGGSLRVPGPRATAGAAADPVAAAEAVLRDAASRVDVTVLALSGAGPGQVHLARPHAWPELARLRELGVRVVDPGPGPGANWLTADWEHAAALRPDVVLFDSRANAVGPEAFPPVGHARVAPWNPETPPSPAAYARFFEGIARTLRHEGAP